MHVNALHRRVSLSDAQYHFHNAGKQNDALSSIRCTEIVLERIAAACLPALRAQWALQQQHRSSTRSLGHLSPLD